MKNLLNQMVSGLMSIGFVNKEGKVYLGEG